MARSLDIINIVDLEATCWEKEPPHGQVSEIIEIGIAELRISDLTVLGKESILVRPERSSISPFCTKLTTLRQSDVDNGIYFEEALSILRKRYRSKDRTWASYGNYDYKMMERQCRETHYPYPFGNSHINIKAVFALQKKLHSEVGMHVALEMIGRQLVGQHHRGGDDSWNIAHIAAWCLQ